MVTKLTTTVSL